MSVVHTGVTDLMCSYCGRPIVGGPFVTGNAGMYHPECTQSPFTKPTTMQPQSVLIDNSQRYTWGILQDRIAELERQLETIRNETLEEAAGVCELRGRDIGGAIQPARTAEAIRKLKR